MQDGDHPTDALGGESEVPTVEPVRPANMHRAAPDASVDVALVQEAVGTRYRVLGRAGEGGMGCVFRAVDVSLDRHVAIKTARSVVSASGDRLVAEARSMARLRHANLCHVVEANSGDNAAGLPYIVMEWIDGVPLSTAWKDWSLERRLDVLEPIIGAIGAAHSAGIIHRDLKPANILVDATGTPIIVDFGLARSSTDSGTPATQAGTPGYAAPEQFGIIDGAVGPQSDVFALGVILYEAITDQSPFEGATPSAMIEDGATPVLPEVVAPDTPPALQAICLVAMEHEPARRYESARSLLEDLARYRRGESVVARPSVFTNRFLDQVEEQGAQVSRWFRHGLITRPEHVRFQRLLSSVQRPESAWVIDSRTLSLSQILLYVGAWGVLLGLTVGAWWTWDDVPVWLRQALAWIVTGAMLGIGAWLNLHGQKRVALAYLATATLAGPIAVWLLLKDADFLVGAEGAGMGAQELAMLVTEPVSGLFNRQILVVAGVWLLCSLVMRVVTRSGAFSLFAVLAAVAGVVFGWASLGRFDSESLDVSLSELALFLGGAAFLTVPLGLWLDRVEQSAIKARGPSAATAHDAWSVLGASVLLIPVSLGAVAYLLPERYLWFKSLGSWTETAVIERQALAFMINGLFLLVVSYVLTRHDTLLRGRLAEVLRWLIPTHFIGALLALEIDDARGIWWFWLGATYVAAIASCFISVPRQWKPFLITGLAYLAIAYVRTFDRALNEFPDNVAVRVTLMVLATVVGAGTMVLGWLGPLWWAKRRGS